MGRVFVAGSINMDVVATADRHPKVGETVAGQAVHYFPGGKGANQAVAAARLGAEVALVGAVGDDAFGTQLHEGLMREGVSLDHVARITDCGSGTASITVAEGENHIIVVPAANARVTPAQVERSQSTLASADAILVQMEIPLESVEATLRLGHKLGKPVILNPAPAQKLPTEWLKLTRYLTPNQHELAILLGADGDEDFVALMKRTPAPVVLTRGSDGAWFRDGSEPQHQPGFKVDAVDTTGAGDTFNAALAVFLHEGIAPAVRKACAAAALSVTKLGAQGGMPTRAELEAFL
jgi:ribokinase